MVVAIFLGSIPNYFSVFAEENNTSTNEDIAISKNGYDSNLFSEYFLLHSNAKKTIKSFIKKFESAYLKENSLFFEIEVQEDGLYGIGLNYKTVDSAYSNISLGIKIDKQYPFEEAKKLEFPRMWCDDGDSNRVDAVGNEFAPQQVEYKEFYYNEPICDVTESNERYMVYLSAGTHNVEIITVKGEIELESFTFAATASAEKYAKPEDTSLYYKGESIIIEGEAAAIKSNYFLIGKADTSSVNVTPHDAVNSKINYIGGGTWKTVGDTLIWETPELEEGYYQIGFSYRQNFIIGGTVYRKLTVDGEVPFEEAQSIGFNYDDNWKQMFFTNDSNETYLLYLSAGKHQIALTVTAGEMAEIRDSLTKASNELGSLYIDITMITGENVDVYRDYELFKQIGDMKERLENIQTLLQTTASNMLKITGETNGSNYSIIMNMSQVITQMLENKYDAHKYLGYYYSNYCSISSVIQALAEMPLSLDKIVLSPVGAKKPTELPRFTENILFSVKRFFTTFVKDYSAVAAGDENSLTVWVNWGRDQAQVLSALIDNSFTPKTGITVDLKLSNAGLIQANILGDGPDCILMESRSSPVNLAMRGVLYDLYQFDDCDEVLKRFQKDAELPYRYRDGLYALPDTQSFFVMFYRKDILEELNIDVPKTWDDFSLAAKILMRNNMNVCLPNNASGASTQIDAGVGNATILPTLLLQNDVPLYIEDGKKTNLLSAEVMETVEMWTDFYRKQKFPITMDLYTRFRVGTTPLGITTYTFYTTLKAAAAEIEGQWGVTTVPGTVKEDGTVSYASSGSGTGCCILKKCKNPEAAWEFLKWWTDEDTQLSYSYEVEAILGPTGRIAVANIEAFKNLDWDEEMLDELLNAWDDTEEIPEYPGSYYLGRSIYQCFWNIVNANMNPKDMLMKYGEEANEEIARKWKQYSKDRGVE